MEQWQEPIDIIIASFPYYTFDNPLFNNQKSDTYFNAMQTYFNKLSLIAREVVFIPDIQMYWPVVPTTQLVQQRLHFGSDLKLFEREKEVSLYLLKNCRLILYNIEMLV